MRDYLILLLLLILGFGSINAGTISEKLTGKTIGTTTGYDYSTNTTSPTVNTAKNVFDGNLTTILASAIRTGGWAGLDLGSKHIITKIKYCPYATNPGRLVLGVFEGANNPDFGDAIPILMITQKPRTSIMTAQEINCSKGFRYVRYIGPNDSRSNIAEVEFYGYEADGDNTALPQLTNLPTVAIHTTKAEEILSKENYITGIVSVISGNGANLFIDSLEIKGRGNASWTFPKKPYRMKLYHKANLPGMKAKAKNWTLINNYGDKTLMRNLLAFDISKRLEMTYTPSGKSVDVFLNGEYKGCYQLCDQIEVNPGRVEVDNMESTDISLPNLRGGYLIEIDNYANEEASWFTSNTFGMPVTIKYPKDDEIVSAQSYYIKSYFDSMESSLKNNLSNGISKYIDRETFLRHFLIGEISGNTDTYWSTYMYKKRNDDRFFFGPVWDFDIAFENDYRTYPINNNPEWIYASKGSTVNGARSFVNMILSDAYTKTRLKSIYAQYRKSGVLSLDSLFKVVDDYASEIEQSQKLNFMRWQIMDTKVHMNPVIWGSYEGEVKNIKSYIADRLDWMDKKLNYIPMAIDDTDLSEIRYWAETSTLHIEGLSNNTMVEIFDLTGRMVFSTQASGSLTEKLNQSSYIIRISDSNGGFRTLKCIIP